MKERIIKNEDRLNQVLSCLKNLEYALEEFKSNKKNIELLNNYYGSKKWFKDKELFENEIISNINAGVLSEDSVWDMNEDIKDIISEMKLIIKNFEDMK